MTRINPTEWKAHPVVQLGSAFLAGIGACWAVISILYLGPYQDKLAAQEARQSAAISAREADLSRRDADLNRREEAALEIEKKYNNIASYEGRLRLLEAELIDANIKLIKSGAQTPFIKGNPFPQGVDLIDIGAPRETIRKAYGDNITDRDGYVTVKIEGSYIKEITYQINKDTDLVWAVYVKFDDSNDKPGIGLISMLKAAFGTPTRADVTKIRSIFGWEIGYRGKVYNLNLYTDNPYEIQIELGY